MDVSGYLIGFVEDNMSIFVTAARGSGLAECTKLIGFPTGYCFGSIINNQPITSLLAFVLSKYGNPISAYNLLVVGGLILNFGFALRFFKRLFSRGISVVLATVFLFSPYFAYQSRSHFDLIQFWPVIWFLHIFFFSRHRHKAIYLGLVLTLSIGISNYLGYFTALFTGLYLVFYLVLAKDRATILKRNWLDVAGGLGVSLLTSLLFIAPYIASNYFAPKISMERSTNLQSVNRPFEDFVTFSSRPWYYVLPPVDNPFFGNFSQLFLESLSRHGSYLTQNYFKSEHSSAYLGWVNILLAVVGAIAIATGKIKPANYGSAKSISLPALWLSLVTLLMLSMPPQASLADTAFYLPSYLLFKLFPMFRVLARIGILILFLTLVFTGFGYSVLLKHRAIRPMVVLLILVSLVEFFIPLKITHIKTPPKVYTYIAATARPSSPVVVYPYDKTTEGLFWTTIYNQPLINPKTYENKETNFVSKDFTALLNTQVGLEKARELGARYLIYYYAANNSSTPFFNTSAVLNRIADFKETNQNEHRVGKFIRIVEYGSATSDSAVLYEFN